MFTWRATQECACVLHTTQYRTKYLLLISISNHDMYWFADVTQTEVQCFIGQLPSKTTKRQTSKQNFAPLCVCFLLGSGSEHMHCKQSTGQCSVPLLSVRGSVKKRSGKEVDVSWDSVSYISETSGQKAWQDAESCDSCSTAGPGVDLDRPGDPCNHRTFIPHTGEL